MRTTRYTPTEVSFDKPAMIIKGTKAKAKGPISKGLSKEEVAKVGQTMI